MLFGDRIKHLRDISGLTQAELGKLIGISELCFDAKGKTKKFTVERKKNIFSNKYYSYK